MIRHSFTCDSRIVVAVVMLFFCSISFAAKTYISEYELNSLHSADGFQVIKTMNHQDLDLYLDSMRYSGVKVIDMCALIDANDENYYHDKALRQGNMVAPMTTNGSEFADAVQYDYWDNIVYVVRECWKRGIYVRLSPLGENIYRKVEPNKGMVRIYINLLCRLLQNEVNVVWKLDSSIMGPNASLLIEEMTSSINVHNKKQLICF